MRRTSTLVVGGIALLLAVAVVATRPVRSEPTVRAELHEQVASHHDAPWARVAAATDRAERIRPVLLATLTVAALLLAVRWARSLAIAPALVPVRVDGRRAAPVRGPPASRRPPR